ncbi:MAG: hypothetical protein P9M14_15810 [Candidatus Alcyoniella australis]|nr:hypothetical protein [Candidatus Alcyoniella australis]
MFRHNNEVYLVGRRNVTPDGNYDLGRDGLRVDFVLDLPSQGDTGFAAYVPGPWDNQFVIYNYSSP